MSSARSAAKELLRLSHGATPLTPVRLRLLLLLAQAWSLVLRDSDLFPEDIECGPDGPSIALSDPADGFADPQGLYTEDEADLVRAVWEDFGGHPDADLLGPILSHPGYQKSIGGPWAMDAQDNPVAGQADLPPALASYRRRRDEGERAALVAIAGMPPIDRSFWDGCGSRTPNASKP